MSDFVALEKCLGACILGLLVSEGSELGGCEVGMPDAKDVNRFCVMKSGRDFLIGCLKHNLIYVGHSSQKLSGRFNGHRSDVKVKPKACELSQHFHESKNCKIEKDLKVYILQDNATDTREKREFMEDCWITRLNTKSPNGMNSNLKDFAKTFYSLF